MTGLILVTFLLKTIILSMLPDYCYLGMGSGCVRLVLFEAQLSLLLLGCRRKCTNKHNNITVASRLVKTKETWLQVHIHYHYYCHLHNNYTGNNDYNGNGNDFVFTIVNIVAFLFIITYMHHNKRHNKFQIYC